MSADMTVDLWAKLDLGRFALSKLAPVPDNFRIYEAETLRDSTGYAGIIRFTGGEFRIAKSGPNKGKLSVLVKGTERTVIVSRAEFMAAPLTLLSGEANEQETRHRGL